MVEANRSYHPQMVRTIIAIALWEARKEIERNIQREGRIKLCKVPHREIERLAKAMVTERRNEFLAKAKASSVVQDGIRRLQAKEERKRQRTLERNSTLPHEERRPDLQALWLCKCHAQNGPTNDRRPCAGLNGWADANGSGRIGVI
jgi:hypothetical protein